MDGETEVLGTTLRETIEQAYEEHVADAPSGEPTPASQSAPSEAKAAPEGAPAAPADDRPRGPDGKFIQKAGEAALVAPAIAAAPIVAAPVAAPTPRPSSWKKEFEAQWQKLDPATQQYVLQREGEYAKGVSTYKQEFDQLKPLSEAMQPFLPHLQQANIQPAQWISNLGNAHLHLARGNDQQRLSMFLKLAQDYNVPVQQLFQRGQDGQIYYNPQVQAYQQPQPQAQQAAQQQPDVRAAVQQILLQERAQQSLAEFEREVQTKYPHYEAVKEDMALLLEAGKAPDYPGAYSMALRLHDDLWASTQEDKRKADEAERQRKAQEDVARARRNNVSARSATPTGKPASGDKKGLRAQLEDAYEEHAGAGRV